VDSDGVDDDDEDTIDWLLKLADGPGDWATEAADISAAIANSVSIHYLWWLLVLKNNVL
jgi:hypothetical protein